MGLCRTVSAINNNFGQKSQNFPIHRACNASMGEFPLSFITAVALKNYIHVPTIRLKEFDDRLRAYQRVTDGRTDRQIC